nr:transcription factor [Phoma sp.]
MVRVEALIEQLANQVVNRESEKVVGTNDSESDLATSCSPQDTQTLKHLLPQKVNSPSTCIEYAPVSAALHAALPPHEDINLIIKAGLDVSLHRLMTTSLATLSRCIDGFRAGLAEIPSVDTHPTLLARYLLILATCLQAAHPELHAKEIRCLSEPPRLAMRRLVNAATDLVTSKDELLSSVEGLECVMLESLYLANDGNLRRAWLVCRRAMAVAQLLGLHRVDSQQLPCLTFLSQSVDPRFLWFRIVCTDRQLCLMLGLPQGTPDVSMATESALANDSASGRFERKQCVIASRILERNEASGDFTNDDLATVLKLDEELQQAANEMPSSWWLVPNLASSLHDQNKTIWEMLRLIEQMLYFNLLNLLHLPCMLRARQPA